MSDIDHRAEAVNALKLVHDTIWDSAEDRDALIAVAQVHATLAANQEPAGHPVVPYREELAAWREAVLELLELLESKNAAPPDVEDAAAKVRRLLGNPS